MSTLPCPEQSGCSFYETNKCPASGNNNYDWQLAGMEYKMGISECIEWRNESKLVEMSEK